MIIFTFVHDDDSNSGFREPRPTDDSYVASMYYQLGLGRSPSLEDIEPHAVNMLAGSQVVAAMSLVLGRHIDPLTAQTDTDLREISKVALSSPEHAFAGLCLKRTLDELTSDISHDRNN